MGENMSLTHALEFNGKVKSNLHKFMRHHSGQTSPKRTLTFEIILSIFSTHFIVT